MASDRVQHPDAVCLVPARAEQYPDAEIEVVQDDVDQDRALDGTCPKTTPDGLVQLTRRS